MRHSVFGRKLSRTKNERRRLLQGLVRELIRRGSVKTTLAKAKAVQPLVEKLVTSAKKSLQSRARHSAPAQQVQKVLSDKATQQLLMVDAGTRFASRQSGFTRIVKFGPRVGDASEEARIQFVDERVAVEVVKVPEDTGVKQPAKKEQKPEKMKKPGRPKKLKKANKAKR